MMYILERTIRMKNIEENLWLPDIFFDIFFLGGGGGGGGGLVHLFVVLIRGIQYDLRLLYPNIISRRYVANSIY